MARASRTPMRLGVSRPSTIVDRSIDRRRSRARVEPRDVDRVSPRTTIDRSIDRARAVDRSSVGIVARASSASTMPTESARTHARGLVDYLNDAWTAYHATRATCEALARRGFVELDERRAWSLAQRREVLLHAKRVGGGGVRGRGGVRTGGWVRDRRRAHGLAVSEAEAAHARGGGRRGARARAAVRRRAVAHVVRSRFRDRGTGDGEIVAHGGDFASIGADRSGGVSDSDAGDSLGSKRQQRGDEGELSAAHGADFGDAREGRSERRRRGWGENDGERR